MAERFLDDHRVPIADYDRIVFDEAEIAELRGRLDLETPLRVRLITERTRANYDTFRLFDDEAPYGSEPLPEGDFLSV